MIDSLVLDTEKTSEPADNNDESSKNEAQIDSRNVRKVKWNHSTFYNAIILGLCNFLSPGIWGAMNSLGAGGAEKPYLVNGANCLTFALMTISCFLASIFVHHTSIRFTLLFGTLGFAPYAAGLYTNNRFGTEWLLLFGAALCGVSAGLFWMAQMSIALSYPEPWNRGKFLGFWLSFNTAGQVVGGAVSLGVNAHDPREGKVSYTAYLVFIALQAVCPFVALLLSPPGKVQRKDGVEVNLSIPPGNVVELRKVMRLFCSKRFLLIIPLIAQAVYVEAVMFTLETFWFSVRARALCSFLSGIMGIMSGNLLGVYLDMSSISLKIRARTAFVVTLGGHGGLWIWTTYVAAKYEDTRRAYDWADRGFASPFVCFLLLVAWFQLQYLYLLFIVGNLAKSQAEVIRISGLLRGMESAFQAVSYGIGSVGVMARSGNAYLNFGIWALALIPGWMVAKDIGVSLGDSRMDKEPEE